MTAVAGIVQDGRVYLGADSAGSAGTSLTVRVDRKVFTTGPYAFGFTWSYRMGQLLHHSFKPPHPPANPADLEEFMVVGFIDALRECLTVGGFAEAKNGRETGGEFLAGVNGRLFTIESDYQVGESEDPFAAVGCGDHLALGSLHTTQQFDMTPRERLAAALTVAERYSGGVRGPFRYVETPAAP